MKVLQALAASIVELAANEVQDIAGPRVANEFARRFARKLPGHLAAQGVGLLGALARGLSAPPKGGAA
jgi:hypothetical protein